MAASPNDESDWVEWKNGLDLSQNDTQGTIARHVLGMANRRPEDAARCAGGCGYVIVGAEPGSCAGVTEIDPAVLDQGIHPFLGPEGPGWGAQYVHSHGMSVLVVTVEPPQPGDRIFTLQKEFLRYLAGAVFVRRPGRTVQAGPGDMRVLEDRYAAGMRQAVERDRRVREIRDIGTLVERVFWEAHKYNTQAAWRCEEQNLLAQALIGIDRPLPACEQVVNAPSSAAAFAGDSRGPQRDCGRAP